MRKTIKCKKTDTFSEIFVTQEAEATIKAASAKNMRDFFKGVANHNGKLFLCLPQK